ncbi:MAG: DUF883 domain-containing protein [Planctomycetota bacterium]|nr:MAG: DUF883 domain-containing protein [Planctomycetota bacterium]
MTTHTTNHNESLAANARALLDATADAVGDGLAETRQRLSDTLDAALDGGGDFYGRVKEHVVDGAKSVDEAVHVHPYVSVAISAGIGALAGLILSRSIFRCAKHS